MTLSGSGRRYVDQLPLGGPFGSLTQLTSCPGFGLSDHSGLLNVENEQVCHGPLVPPGVLLQNTHHALGTAGLLEDAGVPPTWWSHDPFSR